MVKTGKIKIKLTLKRNAFMFIKLLFLNNNLFRKIFIGKKTKNLGLLNNPEIKI